MRHVTRSSKPARMIVAIGSSAPGAGLPFVLTPTLKATTLLYGQTPLIYGNTPGIVPQSGVPAANTADKFFFTGRSDNFEFGHFSTDPDFARIDPEAIRVSGV